jgi:hypothetical protein
MLTPFTLCIQVAFGAQAQRIESIGQGADRATPSLGSIVYFWRQAGANTVRKACSCRNRSKPIYRTINSDQFSNPRPLILAIHKVSALGRREQGLVLWKATVVACQ